MAAPADRKMRQGSNRLRNRLAPPEKRRGSLLAAHGAALLLLAALVGCAAPVQPQTGNSGLALDFSWPDRTTPTLAQSLNPPPPPHQVTVQWNPRRYSHQEIAQIADQQCLTFGREAKPASGVSGGAIKTQRFDCVMTATAGAVPKG
jgi:hypothetical protein